MRGFLRQAHKDRQKYDIDAVFYNFRAGAERSEAPASINKRKKYMKKNVNIIIQIAESFSKIVELSSFTLNFKTGDYSEIFKFHFRKKEA